MYKYRFQCPDSSDYDLAYYELQLDSLESFPWNSVDNVVGNHGTGDHKLSDLIKYWHTRLVLMPVSKDYTIRNIESGQTKCDSREEMSHEDFFLYVEHFVRFLFMLNKLNRSLDPVTVDIMSGDKDAINNLFRDDQLDLLFVKDSVISKHTFIAIDAIWWSIEHYEDIENEILMFYFIVVYIY
ncbi:unnamed protein product [Adineta steineri]|uniref:Uncharacterized protein n=1 Tax=Adineta steineri TaxID=433720 RepID=A0A818U4R8_9BILA|nr:unnamed protein product [Adineta steineri]